MAVLIASVGSWGGVASADELAAGSGPDLGGWELALGDGGYASPGQAPVDPSDIALTHFGDRSQLTANVARRGIMAHAIAFTRVSDIGGMSFANQAGVEFRVPRVPSVFDWDFSAQTLEAGIFVWDGAESRLDHGIAVQWVLNPWVSNFGAIRVWYQTENGPMWLDVAYLRPDDNWHQLSLEYRADTDLAVLNIDGQSIPVSGTLTPKSGSWGTTVDARFQVEVISVWPGVLPEAPSHQAEFRNWYWTMTN